MSSIHTLCIPPSKSHSMRAILFATMGSGRCLLKGLLRSPDIEAAMRAAQGFGARVHPICSSSAPDAIDVMIEGVAGIPAFTTTEIDVGNSGQVLRFFGALAALGSQPMLFKGDASICSQRTIEPLLDALRQRGAKAHALHQNGFAPMCVQGPMHPGPLTLCGRDSQPVSGMLMAMAFLPGKSHIHARSSGELPWIALTLSWLKRLGIGYTQEDVGRYQVAGHAHYASFEYTPPGDFSSAAFPAIAALLTGQEVCLKGLDCTDVQGDRLLFTHLRAMGAHIEEDAAAHQVCVRKQSAALQGIYIDVNPLIDALPILAVLGCFTKGEMHLTGALPARGKECDRIHVMAEALKRLGADIEEEPEGLRIRQAPLRAPLDGLPFSSHGDHRIAMALVVAALRMRGDIVITQAGCIKKSYPTFLQQMRALGAWIQETEETLHVKGMQ